MLFCDGGDRNRRREIKTKCRLGDDSVASYEMRLERTFIAGLSERGLPAETSGLTAKDEESSKR